jgi:tetratricopeptide (TPR) repeat protein
VPEARTIPLQSETVLRRPAWSCPIFVERRSRAHDRLSERAGRAAARNCESAGLTSEADILYRLAETLDARGRASAASSLARVLIGAGRVDQARPYALDGNDPVLVARLLLEAHDFAEARRLMNEARARDPFDPRIASARGRLAFLEKRFAEAVEDLLEAALLRPDGAPDPTDRRFLRAARALAPDRIPGWKDAVAAARTRLAEEAEKRAPGVGWPDRSAELLRSLIRRGGGATSGALDLARRLSEVPALKGLDEAAFFTAAEFGELRRLATGSALYRTGDRAGEISLVVSGSVDLIRTTPVGDQALGEAGPGDFVGEEALTGRRVPATFARAAPRRCSASRPTSSHPIRTAPRGSGSCGGGSRAASTG